MSGFFRLFFAVMLAAASPVWAGGIALVLSDRGGLYDEFYSAFAESLANSSWAIVSNTTQGEIPPSAANPPDLTVTVGGEALRRTLARGETSPILATLLPRKAFEKILADFRRPPGRTSAIYLDQPPARKAALLKNLLPAQKRFAFLVSNETRPLLPAMRTALGNVGLTLDTEDVNSDAELLPALTTLLSRGGTLIAIPDSTIYNRNNIKAILVSAFRYQRPVIGYSTAFVSAGALAALHSTPSQIARQAADTIIQHGTNLPAPSGPSQFAIAINHSVSQALGLNIPEEATLRRAILAEGASR